mmetsp:Transcript_35950/g.84191  ORF Transcript_35950/g.84191 Transcript_35950/m.84191 type:complete len:935 (+) Transcript_35950:62-2866(+)
MLPSIGVPAHHGKVSGAGVGKFLPLALGAAIIGLLTTISAVVIDLSAAFFADLRHGICIQRIPGDERPLWLSTLRGSWRPYDRLRCCGGSMLVDHATQQCRAPSIIQHATRKRFASLVRSAKPFGQPVGQRLAELQLGSTDRRTPALHHGSLSPHDMSLTEELSGTHISQSHAARSATVDKSVGNDASEVRSHISHLFGPDPTESWAEEFAHTLALTEAEAVDEETSVNEDVVQTYSESVGTLTPYNEWVPWQRLLGGYGQEGSMLIYVLGSGFLATLAAFVTMRNPAAKGSGIPEVKARVAGFALPASFCQETLVAKTLGLALCVGAGLATGKEGPLIHIGGCWGVLLARPLLQWRPLRATASAMQSSSSDTEFICIGAAAGVAAAFGAPLAGVLFAVEELGTTLVSGLRHTTMLCAFSAAAVAALALKWLDLARTQRLTLFEVDYKQVWVPWEALPFCLLGVVGGVVGGSFVMLNSTVHRRRLAAREAGRFTWFLPTALDSAMKRCFCINGAEGLVMEVGLLAIFTALSNYPHALTWMLQNDAISALFAQCPSGASDMSDKLRKDPLGFCMEEDGVATLVLLMTSAALRFMQTSVTFGALVPAGLFVPSLYIGGCLGRAVGVLVKHFGPSLVAVSAPIEPGIYAMVGAGAVLAGVSRLTVSLAVALVELTGGLTYVVPFMLAVLIAKWVGDLITDGQSIYDIHALLNGLAKVEQPENIVLANSTIIDIQNDQTAEKDHHALWVTCGTVRKVDLRLHCQHHRASDGFPVVSVDHRNTATLLGWASTERMLAALGASSDTNTGVCQSKSEQAWCYLAVGACPKPQRWRLSPMPVAVDLSGVLDRKRIIHVQEDCSLMTAYCIFRDCPQVERLLSASSKGSTRSISIVTRSGFEEHLNSGMLPAAFTSGEDKWKCSDSAVGVQLHKPERPVGRAS